MSQFPVLDFDRDSDDFHANGREVLTEDLIEPLIEKSGRYVALPIRSIIDNNDGPGFEIGPYYLLRSDVVALYNLLGEHIARWPSDFRRIDT
ncbi:hypothetical protein [Rhodococcus jostii]|uniref:hypothetical protein n=1 Tax=Rhodococcus jostii TaxID=132919 RepID=UPI003637E927